MHTCVLGVLSYLSSELMRAVEMLALCDWIARARATAVDAMRPMHARRDTLIQRKQNGARIDSRLHLYFHHPYT